MLKIGPLPLATPLVLAPMAGITDTCARRIAKRFGAGLVYSEMVSAAGLARRQARTLDMLAFHPEEQPYGVQIFGAEPAEMAEAARHIRRSGTFDRPGKEIADRTEKKACRAVKNRPPTDRSTAVGSGLPEPVEQGTMTTKIVQVNEFRTICQNPLSSIISW